MENIGNIDALQGDGGFDHPVNVDFDKVGSVTMTQEGLVISPEEDVPETPDEQLQQELEQVKEERDQYKGIVEQIQQSQKEELRERIEEINQSLPEDSQKTDEEIEELTESSNTKVLRQSVDLMETVAESAKEEPVVQSKEEDLGALANQGADVEDEAEKKVNQISQNLFGKSLDEVLDAENNPELEGAM